MCVKYQECYIYSAKFIKKAVIIFCYQKFRKNTRIEGKITISCFRILYLWDSSDQYDKSKKRLKLAKTRLEAERVTWEDEWPLDG